MKTVRFMKPRFAFLLFSLVLAYALSSTAGPARSKNYAYPFNNQYVSTLTSAVSHSELPGRTIALEVRSDRRHVPLMEGRNTLHLRLFQQKNPAPLMFVIPGVGGYPASGSAMIIAETFYKAGYSVITLPSTLSWQYALSVSETAIPGYMPRDAKEYYSLLKRVTNVLKTKYRVQPTSYAISGVSLGGLASAFVAEEDRRQGAFQFRKVILINPAVNVAHGIQVLDALNAAGDKFTPAYKSAKLSMIFGLGEELLGAPLTPQTFEAASPKLAKLNDTDLQWVIGYTFRQSIRDVIVTGQRVHNTGLLKTKATKYRQDALLAEASRYSFADYMNLLVYPSLKGNTLSREQVLAQSSLYALPELLKSPNVYVFENEDDLIVTNDDLAFLKNVLGSRLTTYPHGGHLGNLWFEQNRQDLFEIAKPVR